MSQLPPDNLSLADYMGYRPFLDQSLQLGGWGSANQSPTPHSQRWYQLPREVETVQRNSEFPNRNKSAVKRRKRMDVRWPSNSKGLFYNTSYLTKNSEIAVWGNADWGNERAKPTFIIIQNQQRLSEIYGSINSSLNILFRNMEVASRKTAARVIRSYRSLPLENQAGGWGGIGQDIMVFHDNFFYMI